MENVRKQFNTASRFIIKREKKEKLTREFSRREEVVHALTHGLGAALGVVGLVLLMSRVAGMGAVSIGAALIYGISFILLFTASAVYHTSCAIFPASANSPIRNICMKCDHSMIYILIWGTYTPACAAMGGAIGIVLFSIVSVCAIVGIILNVIDVKRFERVSMLLYIVAGWTIVVAGYPFIKAIGSRGFLLLAAGGVLYTVGIIFYKLKRIPNMHVLWHLFVLAGAAAHYMMVYFYCF